MRTRHFRRRKNGQSLETAKLGPDVDLSLVRVLVFTICRSLTWYNAIT
jgi:hypothetical protein